MTPLVLASACGPGWGVARIEIQKGLAGRCSHFALAQAREGANRFGKARPRTLSRPRKEGGDAPRRLGKQARSECFSLRSQ
jgi:hypothetical protein